MKALQLERLVALARYSRGHLIDEGVISEDEYAALAGAARGPELVASLETADHLRHKLKEANNEITRLRAEVAKLQALLGQRTSSR